MTPDIAAKIKAHSLENPANLSGADLSGADLSGADLYGANLREADLREANLREADLRGANLRGADLREANLRMATLRGADLRGAYLRMATLRGADLREAYLREADLRGANLSGAALSGADLTGTTLPAFQIPQTGTLEVWKICQRATLVRLLIPADAPRTASLVGRKCRAARALVLEIVRGDSDGAAYSRHNPMVVYRVGETVFPRGKCYDPDPRIECAPGIHFFLTREEAENY